MSQQALSSQRFGRNPGRVRKVNRFFNYNNKVHDTKVSIQQRETQIVNVQLGGQTQIEPSLVDMAENFVLKCTIANPGTTATNWGIDLISSITLRSGANTLLEYNPAKVYYRYILDKAPKELRDRAKEVFFQGTTIYLPLPVPGSQLLYDNWSRPQGKPFPMGGLNSKRPITWDIKFNTGANLSSDNAANISLSSVVLQYDEILMENPSQVRRPFSMSCKDIKIQPGTIALGAGAEVEQSGLEALQGSVEGYYIYNQLDTNMQAADDQSITEKIDEAEIFVDGRSLMKFTDQKQLQATHILRGWNVADSDGTGQNYLFLSGFPSEDLKHAYLHTSGVKRISMKLKTANASHCVIAAICHRTFSTSGNVIKVQEQ